MYLEVTIRSDQNRNVLICFLSEHGAEANCEKKKMENLFLIHDLISVLWMNLSHLMGDPPRPMRLREAVQAMPPLPIVAQDNTQGSELEWVETLSRTMERLKLEM